jgi:hypothetical protein
MKNNEDFTDLKLAPSALDRRIVKLETELAETQQLVNSLWEIIQANGLIVNGR